jgi:hypothetical protein
LSLQSSSWQSAICRSDRTELGAEPMLSALKK